MCLVFYHRVDHPMNEGLKHFGATRKAKPSATLSFGIGKSALQNLLIQSVIFACCCALMELAAVGRV